MSFAHPAALAWAALALPIIGFYILKIRLRRVPVSTSMFWDQIFEEKRPRSLWQHLRHLLSLLCQLALLGLLVLALGEPLFRWDVLGQRRLVLIIDNSASMNAADVTSSRLDEARRLGREVVEGLRSRDEMAILAAGTEPRVHCGLTNHRRSLLTAIDTLPATEGPTRVPEAVALARRLLGDRDNGRIIVLTDGGFEGVGDLAKSKDISIQTISTRAGNAGLVRFQARRSLIDPVGYEILADVVNASDKPVECRLEIELEPPNGQPETVDVVPLKLEPNGRWTRTIEKVSPGGGRLVATLTPGDALPADDRAWAILPRRERRPVTLVTTGNLFLEGVFRAIPLVDLTVAAERPATTSGLTVFHRDVPATLPPGPVLVIDPAGSTDLWDLGKPLDDPIVAKIQDDSALLGYVKLNDLIMPGARKLTPKGEAQILAESPSGDPLLCAFERRGGKVLVLLADLDRSELPLQTAFPILATNALGWFSGTKGDLRESLATGDVTEVEVPSNAHVALKAPDGGIRPLP